MADVFVSYVSEDCGETFAPGLESAGFPVRWDRHTHGVVSFKKEDRQFGGRQSRRRCVEPQHALDEKMLLPLRLDGVGFHQTHAAF